MEDMFLFRSFFFILHSLSRFHFH